MQKRDDLEAMAGLCGKTAIAIYQESLQSTNLFWIESRPYPSLEKSQFLSYRASGRFWALPVSAKTSWSALRMDFFYEILKLNISGMKQIKWLKFNHWIMKESTFFILI